MTNSQRGFTLLEVMLVIMLMALIVSQVRLPNLLESTAEQVELHTQKFAAKVDLASEYAVLNNALLGVAVAPNAYQFMLYDGQQWQVVDTEPLQSVELPESYQLELQLDGLDWQQQNILSSVEFIDEDTLEKQQKEGMPEFPQVFILPSGEISPFQLAFIYDDGFEDAIEYRALGHFTSPITVLSQAEFY